MEGILCTFLFVIFTIKVSELIFVMETKVATLLGISFSSDENVVMQSDTAKLGSTQRILVVRFDQQAFEDMLSGDKSSPVPRLAKPSKTRKTWVIKSNVSPPKTASDALPASVASAHDVDAHPASVPVAASENNNVDSWVLRLRQNAQKKKSDASDCKCPRAAPCGEGRRKKSIFDRDSFGTAPMHQLHGDGENLDSVYYAPVRASSHKSGAVRAMRAQATARTNDQKHVSLMFMRAADGKLYWTDPCAQLVFAHEVGQSSKVFLEPLGCNIRAGTKPGSKHCDGKPMRPVWLRA